MPNDQVLLLQAVTRHDVETVNFLIFQQNVNPKFLYNGKSPIVTAVKAGSVEILDILIGCKCDLNTPDYTDLTWHKRPIHIASTNGHLALVKKLLENNVSVNSVDLHDKTALHWAASLGHVNIIRYLLSKGANVNASQKDGFTPLHCAAALNNSEACEVILSSGSHIDATDDDGWTSIHHAAAYGHFNVVKALHRAGASLSIKTPMNDTILHISSYTTTPYKVDILRYLVENDVPINQCDIEGKTALHIACTHNGYDNVKCLIDLGADLNTNDNYEDSPLFSAACGYDSQNIIILLIRSGYNCSRDKWIHEDRFPLALANNLPLVAMLKFHASHPRTLQEMCCFCILKYLKDKSITFNSINLLPLPKAMKTLLKNVHDVDCN